MQLQEKLTNIPTIPTYFDSAESGKDRPLSDALLRYMITSAIPLLGLSTNGHDTDHEPLLGRSPWNILLKMVRWGFYSLFPRVIKDLAEGTFKRDEKGGLYYGETPIPKGYRI